MNEENATTWTWEDIEIRTSLRARGLRDPLARWPTADYADYRAMLEREEYRAQHRENFAAFISRLEGVRS